MVFLINTELRCTVNHTSVEELVEDLSKDLTTEDLEELKKELNQEREKEDKKEKRKIKSAHQRRRRTAIKREAYQQVTLQKCCTTGKSFSLWL